jgi:hypothetical protein
MGLPRRHVFVPTVAEVTPATPATASAARESTKSSANLDRPLNEFTSRSVPSPRIRREPEVLVPKGELLAVVQFYESVHTTTVDSEQLFAAQEAQKPVELKPIEITPLEPLAKPIADSDNGPSLF